MHGAGSPVGRHAFLAVLAIVIAVATTSAGTDRVATEDAPILHVGPTRELKSPSAAAKVALDGTIVEIDAGESVSSGLFRDFRSNWWRFVPELARSTTLSGRRKALSFRASGRGAAW